MWKCKHEQKQIQRKRNDLKREFFHKKQKQKDKQKPLRNKLQMFVCNKQNQFEDAFEYR